MDEAIGETSIEVTDALASDRSRLDDEMYLMDLWIIVCRSWLWVLAGLIIGISIAVAYIVSTVPTYESRAVIRVGNVPNLGPIEDLGVLSVKLIDQYGQRSINGSKTGAPHLDEKSLKAKDNVLELVTVGHSPDETRDYLGEIVEKTLQRHERYYDEAMAPLRQRLAAIGTQIKLITKQMREFEGLINQLKASNTVQASLLAIERSNLLKNLDQLERDRVAIQLQIATPYSNQSQVIVEPVRSKKPVAPRTGIAIAGGVFLGILSGIFVVFLKEFLARWRFADASRRERQKGP